uniref:Uncharacterized protein n=1 Tax=Oryza punctata TaxID=4537 RepID=A0A0E0M0W8_ORYPU
MWISPRSNTPVGKSPDRCGGCISRAERRGSNTPVDKSPDRCGGYHRDLVWSGGRRSGYEQAFAESPRRRHLSSDCGGRYDPNQLRRYSMDELLECKRQLEKNKEGAFRGAVISEHKSKEDELFKRMISTFDKLCRCLDEQEHVLQGIEDQVQNDKKFDQVKQFLVAIPSFVCIGLVLDRMHMFG